MWGCKQLKNKPNLPEGSKRRRMTGSSYLCHHVWLAGLGSVPCQEGSERGWFKNPCFPIGARCGMHMFSNQSCITYFSAHKGVDQLVNITAPVQIHSFSVMSNSYQQTMCLSLKPFPVLGLDIFWLYSIIAGASAALHLFQLQVFKMSLAVSQLCGYFHHISVDSKNVMLCNP